MPLNEGAKPGSKGFSENVATEVKAGKPEKQAVAIAYSEAKKDARGSAAYDEGFREGYRDGPRQAPFSAPKSAVDDYARGYEAGKRAAYKYNAKTDGEALMDALSTLRGRVEVASVNKNDADGFPASVSYKGKRYSATGKTGKHVKTGEPSAEYRFYGEDGNKDERVWRRKTGEIEPD